MELLSRWGGAGLMNTLFYTEGPASAKALRQSDLGVRLSPSPTCRFSVVNGEGLSKQVSTQDSMFPQKVTESFGEEKKESIPPRPEPSPLKALVLPGWTQKETPSPLPPQPGLMPAFPCPCPDFLHGSKFSVLTRTPVRLDGDPPDSLIFNLNTSLQMYLYVPK